MARKVFITGGSGFIGQALIAALRARGDDVSVLTRNATRAADSLTDVTLIEGDAALGGDWQARVSGHDAVINLAGQSIAGKRWDAQYRQLLMDSRVETTRYLVEAIGRAESRPRVLVSASGIDYYPFDVDLDDLGMDSSVDVTEDARPGDTFLARMCRQWEAEAFRAREHGVRVVCMRTGVVLGKEGALDRMEKPFKLFVGGRLSHGHQWFSWVHLADVVAAYLFALENVDLTGPVNLVAPDPVTNRDFTDALAKALHRPAIFPVPALALRLAVGELHEYLIHGRRAVPRALREHGFEFQFPNIESALADIYGE